MKKIKGVRAEGVFGKNRFRMIAVSIFWRFKDDTERQDKRTCWY
jgi:hypothetical protein